jgi:carbamate kinase
LALRLHYRAHGIHYPTHVRPLVTLVVVVAVGGNALTAAHQSGTCEEIEANAADMALTLAPVVASGHAIAVVHGNGPQVGNLAIQQDEALSLVPAQPLPVLSAMTQGQLGSILARAVDAHCGAGTAVALVTHVTVDADDPAFSHPTKPIGPFFSAERAHELARARGWTVVEDSGRGHRRVVASPRPTGVIELGAVRSLLEAGHVVLAAGGGGVAVVSGPGGQLRAVDAVVDKDLAAALLARSLGAQELYLLTGVDCVMLDFGTARERPAHRLRVDEARAHLADGQFPPGSMGPKVTAALQFLGAGGTRAIITSADRLADAVAGVPGAGTVLAPESSGAAASATIGAGE